MPIPYHGHVSIAHVSIADKPEAVPLQGSKKKYTSCAAAGLSVIATEKECEEAAKSLGFVFEGNLEGNKNANCIVVFGDEVYFAAGKGQQNYGCDWAGDDQLPKMDCICHEGVLQSYFACFLRLPLFL